MPTGYVMTAVAHPDDDLFFVNPDGAAAITAGLPTVTVYVTAGQLSGNGTTDGQRARNRQLGVMAAYAQMAGITSPAWTGDVLWAGRRQVERYTLAGAAGAVEVVFMNLPDGGLDAVYNGQTKSTVLVDSGLVTRQFSYTKTDAVAALAGLMARYQPTVLHAQDPLPDTRYSADHADHLAACRLAEQAALAYSDSLLLVSHRCYNIADAPINLSPTARAGKQTTASAYQAYDTAATGTGWLDRMYHRWPRGTSWIGRNADGRLQVLVVRSGLLWTWWQTATGDWAGPVTLNAASDLAPTIAVGANADGRMQIFARRADHRIVTTYQTAINAGFATAWVDMGNPNAGLANSDQIGTPTCTLLGDGRLMLAVRNGGGGVSAKTQMSPNGGWPASWADLGGTDVQDGLAAATNPDGCVELVGMTRTGVLHWYQDVVGGPYVLNSAFPGSTPASPPAAVLCQDGTCTVAYRQSDSGEVALNSQTAPAAGWNATLTAPGRPGSTSPALVAPPGGGHQPMLISRASNGKVAVGVPAGVGAWTWTDLAGGPVIDTPAAALDPTGAVVLAAVGMDGTVRVCRQTAAGAGQPFGAWQTLPA